ncbi:MAG: zinc ribbon domain-containing protein, partial [Gemmatimonadota bacterium]
MKNPAPSALRRRVANPSSPSCLRVDKSSMTLLSGRSRYTATLCAPVVPAFFWSWTSPPCIPPLIRLKYCASSLYRESEMPTYEYRCPVGHEFEKFQKMSDKPRAKCPVCGKPATRLMS